MAKLKLDLHPIYSDSARIEAALAAILQEAEEKRIGEVEIIPGKGSGALKKTVLRFLERPEIRSRYHRIVKDSDNWGRLFVYFRWSDPVEPRRASPEPSAHYICFCCGAINTVDLGDVESGKTIAECPACGSPNRLILRKSAQPEGIEAVSGYE